jgi:hypothetical protein
MYTVLVLRKEHRISFPKKKHIWRFTKIRLTSKLTKLLQNTYIMPYYVMIPTYYFRVVGATIF